MSASSESKKVSVDSSKPSRERLRRADSSNSLNTSYSRYYYNLCSGSIYETLSRFAYDL